MPHLDGAAGRGEKTGHRIDEDTPATVAVGKAAGPNEAKFIRLAALILPGGGDRRDRARDRRDGDER
jgi:hypothetical protein